MLQSFSSKDFKIMPWTNGGGTTTELFRIENSLASSFLFRLSLANVNQDGPFSIFQGIDRVLLLIEGKGMELCSSENIIRVNNKLVPYSFNGEEDIKCRLIQGPCIDFNIMTDRKYAKSAISVIHPEADNITSFQADCDLKFIYDINEETLVKMMKNDLFEKHVKQECPLIVIDITKL